MHITAWVIGIILFFVTYSMLKGANPKAKMLHMITRLFYLLIFLTGGMLITDFGAYAVKMIVGIIVIAAMEMVLVRTKKKKHRCHVDIVHRSACIRPLFRTFTATRNGLF